jgi:hypothetical protein
MFNTFEYFFMEFNLQIMKVTFASLLCLVALTMGAAVPSVGVDQVHGAALMENQPSNVMAIESGEYAQQPFEQNDDALETSATHHKRYHYPSAYYYPRYYPHYYPQYHYSGYYPYHY